MLQSYKDQGVQGGLYEGKGLEKPISIYRQMVNPICYLYILNGIPFTQRFGLKKFSLDFS